MFRIKPSKNALICLVSVAVIMLPVCGFTYRNRACKLHALRLQIESRQEKLANSEQIAKRLSVVEQDYLDAQAKLGVLEQGVSTKAYVPTLLRQIEDLGKSLNLRVAGVRPKAPEVRPFVAATPAGEKTQAPAKKPDPYDKLDIDIEINGKYWDVVRFLEGITSFPKIIAINSVQMSPMGQLTEVASPVLCVRLSTTAFILKESAQQTKGNSGREANGDSRQT